MNLYLSLPVQKAAAPTTPPRGGKYVKRWWDGQRWQYEYAGEKAEAHGPAAVPELAARDVTVQRKTKDEAATLMEPKPHTMSLHDVATDGMDPEKAYHAALTKALASGESFPLQHPHYSGDLQLSLATSGAGVNKLVVRSADGKKVKDFDSRGAYERWYLGTANTLVKKDPEGRDWLVIKPVVGTVGSDGNLKLSTDPLRQWKIAYADSYPKELQSTQREYKLGNAKTRQLAEARVDELYKKMQSTMGGAAPKTDWLDAADREAIESAKEFDHHAAPGSVADKAQTGGLTWRWDSERVDRVLDVSPAERKRLVMQTVQEFTPQIMSLAHQLSKDTWFKGDRVRAVETMIGDELPTNSVTGKKQMSPEFLAPSVDSPVYQAVERVLDHYDPASGVPFGGYLAGKKGILAWNMRRAKDNLIEEIKHSSGMDVEGKEGSKTTKETLAKPTEEQLGGAQHLRGAGAYGQHDPKEWAQGVRLILDKWENKAPEINAEARDTIRSLVDKLPKLPAIDQEKLITALNQHMLQLGVPAIVAKALERDAVDLMRKAAQEMPVLTRDKYVDPTHQYSYRDGDETNPRFYYTDAAGNLIRYTNAPTGHKDRSSYAAEAKPHSGEPSFTTNPEYFTPDGRKLTVVPDQNVEWNANYHRYDPQNLWAGRWRAEDSGEYRYTYIDSDIRQFPQLQIHWQNVLFDARLPAFRQYVAGLFQTGKLKDEMTALAMVLLDQGRLRAIDLAMLTGNDVQFNGSLVQLGTRQIHADWKVRVALEILKQRQPADAPLFSIPMQKKNGDVDENLARRMGPHYLARVLDQQGLSLLALQTYHATLTFVNEMDRLLMQYRLPWEQAKQQALLAVAEEWGHNFQLESDVMRVMQLIEAVLIDPVAVHALQQAAAAMQVGGEEFAQEPPPAMITIPHVSLDLTDRLPEEVEFSTWLHAYPVHEAAGMAKSSSPRGALTLFEILGHPSQPRIGKGVQGLFDLIKAREGLVPKKIQVTRGGKQYMTTVYVRPGDAPSAPKRSKKAQAEGAKKPKTQTAVSPPPESQGGNELYQELLRLGFVDKLDHLPEDTSKHYTDETGNYVPERQELHQKIIQEFMSKARTVPDHESPVAVMTMGGTGSGKSTATRGMRFDGFVKVDPDAVKEHIPEYQETLREKALNGAKMSHAESSHIANQIRKGAMAARSNVLIDGTGKDLKKMLKMIDDLKEKGYRIHLVMPHIPVEEGRRRAAYRAKIEGRWVPDAVIEEAYQKIPWNFTQLAHAVDKAELFDNTQPFGQPATKMWERPPPKVVSPHHYEQFQEVAKPYM